MTTQTLDAFNPEVPRGALTRWWILAGVFSVEVLGLTLRFDGHRVLAVAGAHGLSILVDRAHLFLAAAIAAASATAIFGGARLRDELRKLSGPSLGRWSWPSFLGHVAAMLGFVWISSQVFEGTALSSPQGAAWLVAWGMFGLASVLLLVLTALPPAHWAPLARREVGVLLVGLLIGALAFGAGQVTGLLWRPLARWTFWVSHGLLRLVTSDTVCEPAQFILGTPSFSVQIAPQCSGYEGIGLIWGLLGASLWFYRRELRFPRAWLLLPLGTLVIWLSNALRIAALVAVGTWLSPSVAEKGFHSQAGWLAFNAVGLGLVAATRRSRFFRREASAPTAEPTSAENPTAVYLAPMLAIVAAAMIDGAFSSGGFDWLYPARLAAALVPFWLYRRSYAALRWSVSWWSIAIGVAVFALWMVLEPPSTAAGLTRSAPPENLGLAWTVAWLAARVVGSVITVPLAEELAFRGYLTRRLIAADFDDVAPGRFTWVSFLVSSVIFGLMHGRWVAGTLAGMLFALAYYRRGSLGDAAVAHALTNALIAFYVLATGSWSLWA